MDGQAGVIGLVVLIVGVVLEPERPVVAPMYPPPVYIPPYGMPPQGPQPPQP